MGSIRVNQQVYEAVRHAQDDFTLGGARSKNISNSEMNDIEDAIAADGNVSQEEGQLLEALRSGTQFTVTNGRNSLTINPSEVNFPDRASVAPLSAGRSTVERDNGDDRVNLPSYIPAQTRGAGTDVINSDTYSSRSAADSAFQTARSRMLDVNNWASSAASEAPISTAGGYNPAIPNFTLHSDADGNGQAGVGDVIKISAGGQDMYVRVEQVVDRPGEFAIQVRPCDASGSTSGATEHMYTNAATNTFRLTQDGNTVTNGFHGRNEVVNDDTGSFLQNRANEAADAGMAAGGRSFSWDVMGDAWRPDP
ncbi:MAG: hypothetical protein CVV27_08110 [Candidatus Melainabacteria bacterium HGW-Melainabacteria-1]|nr:MAG: hypothetical protein CVV27_08110 [Candidatus Melainabacteria bacterium HGW-Melainabacteria-1]